MYDVSALVLSIGEKTTQRAINSLKRQTLPPKEIILIENVTPSYRAGNLGASKVKTEFLMVVGSDTVLDSNCLESLRNCMFDDVGIVVGHLRDPIRGRIQGIKLYRKKCFDIAQMRNTVSPDTDFNADVIRNGFHLIFALNYQIDNSRLLHTFGDHDPEYTHLYTFSKFSIKGRRSSYRKNLDRLIWWMHTLSTSNHPMSIIALIAMCNGFFVDEDKDLLMPYKKIMILIF